MPHAAAAGGPGAPFAGWKQPINQAHCMSTDPHAASHEHRVNRGPKPSFFDLERERHAGRLDADDRDDEDDAYGSPDTLKNEGPLESLGKAISSSVIDSAKEDEARQQPKPQ